jgi:hypothetical protein
LKFERSIPRQVRLAGAPCLALALAFTGVACTTSESVDRDARPSGAAGDVGAGGGGGAGNPGTAGATGTGGSTDAAGQAGVGGRAGAAGQGVAGSTGAGGGGGSAGTSVDAGASAKDSGAGGSGSGGVTGSAGATGSGGTPGTVVIGGMTYPLTFDGLIGPMLNNNCGGCHFDGGTKPPSDGFGISYANVLGPVSTDHRGCVGLDASKRRVVPGHPEASLLYIKVSVTNPPAGCGAKMPNYVGSMLLQMNQDWIKAWILAGAPEK